MQYVAGLMFSESREYVALVCKDRPAWQAGRINAIGGKIEEDESPATAMAREFQEETGVETQADEWNFLLKLEGPDFAVNFFSAFTDKVFGVKTMETEEIRLFSPKQLPPNVISNINWIVPLALDSRVVVPRLFKHKG